MSNGQGSVPASPWEVYRRPQPLASREHLLLSEALTRIADDEFGIDADHVAEAFTAAEPDFIGLADRDDVETVIARLHNLIVTDRLHSFLRPFGGGRPRRMSTDEWELDEPLMRFAWSAMDPRAPFDTRAVPTHWILVARDQVDDLVSGAATVVQRGRPDATERPTGGPAPACPAAGASQAGAAPCEPPATKTGPDRLLRREEVLGLTGFRKSKLYEKVAAKTFPAQITMGTRMSRWRVSEVAEWLRNPR